MWRLFHNCPRESYCSTLRVLVLVLSQNITDRWFLQKNSWYLFGAKIIWSHTHSSRFSSWYLLGDLFKNLEEHSNYFYRGAPPPTFGPKRWDQNIKQYRKLSQRIRSIHCYLLSCGIIFTRSHGKPWQIDIIINGSLFNKMFITQLCN